MSLFRKGFFFKIKLFNIGNTLTATITNWQILKCCYRLSMLDGYQCIVIQIEQKLVCLSFHCSSDSNSMIKENFEIGDSSCKTNKGSPFIIEICWRRQNVKNQLTLIIIVWVNLLLLIDLIKLKKFTEDILGQD